MSTEPDTPSRSDGASEADPAAYTAERRMASGIYGLIVASSVLAAGAADDDIVYVALSVLVTLVVYWLAETYAHVIAVHLRGRRTRWLQAASHELRTGWPMVSTSFTPLLAVLTAAILGADVGTAQTIGMLCATVLLFVSGWMAGRRNDLTGFRLLLAALIAAGFGVALVGLKSTIHH